MNQVKAFIWVVWLFSVKSKMFMLKFDFKRFDLRFILKFNSISC